MTVINCFVDDETMRWLEKASAETGRRIDQLAEAAIETAAIEFKLACMRRSPQATESPHE